MRKRRKTGHKDTTLRKAYAMWRLEKDGFTHAELAEMFKISLRSVRWYLKVNGMPRKG